MEGTEIRPNPRVTPLDILERTNEDEPTKETKQETEVEEDQEE